MALSTAAHSRVGSRAVLARGDLRRVHRFIFRGKRIIYDRNSCAPFEADRITWDVLQALARPQQMDDELLRKHDEAAVCEVVARLAELKSKGLLFSTLEPPPSEPEVFTTLMIMFTTYGCDLDCRYCYTKAAPYAGQSAMMSAETAEKAIDFLIRGSGQEKDLFLILYGGEPLLNFPVIEHALKYAGIQAALFHKRFHFSVVTNAVSLTKEKQRVLNENGVFIVASLDGPKGLHDSQRPLAGGSGSHARAAANLRELLASRGPRAVLVKSTFTRHTVRYMPDVAAYLLDLGFRDMSLEPAALPDRHGDAIRTEDLPLVRQAYAVSAERYLRELLNGNIFLFQQFSYVVERVHSPRRCYVHCGAGSGSATVSPTGELYPCYQMVGAKEVRLGDVERGVVNRRVKEAFESAHVQNKRKCRTCWAKYLCGGGCHAHAMKYDNDLLGAHDVECDVKKCCFELGMWLYANLSKSAPDALASVLELESGRRKLAPQERVAPVP